MSEPGEAQDPDRKTAGAYRIATVAGIPVRVHFTFLLILGYFAYLGQRTSGGWLPWVLFALALFTCVVLHELGHALTARLYGIKTRDITLYPMGGVAMFEGRMKPHQELWIALAGPFVNVVLALVIGLYLVVGAGGIPVLGRDILEAGIVPALFWANVSLAIFNLIPAFPMDGGRVLRSLIAFFTDEAKATAIAGGIGQGMAVLLAFFGIMSMQVLLIVVALFVFMGAGQEVQATAARSFLEGFKLLNAMQTRFRTISSGASLQDAAAMLLDGSQHDFPVVVGDEVIGMLTRIDIARGLATQGPTGYVAAHMRREFPTAGPDLPLEDSLELFGGADGSPIVVMEDGRMVGMLTQENLSEFIMLQNAMRQGARR